MITAATMKAWAMSNPTTYPQEDIFIKYHRRDTQIFVLVVGILLGLYGSNIGTKSDIMTLAIPSLVFVYYLMQVFNLHMVSVEAKACARIEKRVNGLFNKALMDWESKVVRTSLRGFNSPTLIVTLAVLLLFLSLFVYFSVASYWAYGSISLIVHIIELLIMIISSALWGLFELRGRLPE